MHTGPCLLTAAVAALALSGCGAAAETPAPPSGPGAVTVAPGDHVCLDRPGVQDYSADADAARARTRVGAGRAARVIVCESQGTQRVPGKGEWQVRTERTAVSGIDELVAALRLPDEPEVPGVACAAYADGVPELWVVDDTGHAVLARWPVDGCAHVRIEAKQALGAVTWRDTGRRLVRQVAPQAALDAGCEVAVKDVAAIERGSPNRNRRAGSFDALDVATSARVCIYRAEGSTLQGTFVHGWTLRRAAWSRLVAELKRTPPAPAGCTRPDSRFAWILLGDKGMVAVELDGCRTILAPDDGLRQATPAVLEALRAVRS